jgi:hypothetical protein
MNTHACEREPLAPTTLLEVTPGRRRLIEDAIESLQLLLDEIDDPEVPDDSAFAACELTEVRS